MGTPVVSYAPRPMSQMVDDVGDVIIEDLPKMLLEKGKVLRRRKGSNI